MDLNDLTIGEVKKLCKMVKGGGESHSIPIGQTVFIRTVTLYYTGRVENVTDTDIVLSEAAWIADTGRFHGMLTTGECSEVEPYPDEIKPRIMRSAIIEVATWPHPLPRNQK